MTTASPIAGAVKSNRAGPDHPTVTTGIFDRVALIAMSGVGSAVGATLLVLPWLPARGSILAALLLTPPGLVAAFTSSVVLGWARRAADAGRREELVRHLVRATLVSAVVGVVVALSNLLFLAPPAAGVTLVGYAVAALLGVGTWMLATRSLTSKFGRAWLRRHDSRAAAGAALAVGSVLLALDSTVMTAHYAPVHVAIESIALFFLSLAILLLVGRRPRVRSPALAGVGLTVLVLLAGAHPSSSMFDEVARSPTAPMRALVLARGAMDGDGDGFSAALGGGDCNDSDAGAYPFSLQKDCLGFVPDRAGPAPRGRAMAPGVVPAPGRPDVVLLLTLDAFRCGFEHQERPELVAACPHITRLASRGNLRRNAHTTYPATKNAILDLLTLDSPAEERTFLATHLAARGYATVAIPTHPYVFRGAGVRESFEQLDESMIADAIRPDGVTAEAVTDLAWEKISTATERKQRLFLWAHYYDAHAPYVLSPGSVWRPDALEAYVAEVQRVDAAVGRLVRLLEGSEADTLVLITADHGEAFGEHGHETHAANLYEEGTRVPIVTWRSRGAAPKELPSGLGEVAEYLVAAVDEVAFRSSEEALITVQVGSHEKSAIVKDGHKLIYNGSLNYFELYDLAADPREEQDLASHHPERVAALGRRMGELLRLRQ